MSHEGNGQEPARWRLIEAMNGYDVDNGVIRDHAPSAPARTARRRGGRNPQTVARLLLGLSPAHRRRRRI